MITLTPNPEVIVPNPKPFVFVHNVNPLDNHLFSHVVLQAAAVIWTLLHFNVCHIWIEH